MCSIWRSPRCSTRWSSASSRWSKPDAGARAIRGRIRTRDATASLALLHAAQQEHALLAEHVPDPPRQVQRHRPAERVERHGAVHLDVDLVAKLHKLLDGPELDVGGVVPRPGKIPRARQMPADQELQPHLPEAEIRERDDGA